MPPRGGAALAQVRVWASPIPVEASRKEEAMPEKREVRRKYDQVFRARSSGPALAGELIARPQATVYECPSCEQRYLGLRRCGDCNLFCRRVGPGGLCPHFDGFVAHSHLGG